MAVIMSRLDIVMDIANIVGVTDIVEIGVTIVIAEPIVTSAVIVNVIIGIVAIGVTAELGEQLSAPLQADCLATK